MENSEKFGNENDNREAEEVTSPEESEPSLQDLGQKFKVPLGAMIVAAAAGGFTAEAPAQTVEGKQAQVQPESAERRIVRTATVEHPTEGKLDIQIYYKAIDPNKPVFDGNNYGMIINGEERVVTKSRSIRSGSFYAEFQSADGRTETIMFPASFGAGSEKLPEFKTADGQVINFGKK